jgi:hypothetical protein
MKEGVFARNRIARTVDAEAEEGAGVDRCWLGGLGRAGGGLAGWTWDGFVAGLGIGAPNLVALRGRLGRLGRAVTHRHLGPPVSS